SAGTDIQSSGCGGCFDSSTPVLSKDTLFFNSQGGIDNVILFQSNWDFPPLNSFRSNFNDNFGDCELIPANYNLIEDGVMKTVENDYCKDNYCYARKIFGWITPSGWLSTRSIPPFPCGDGCPYETCECHEDWFVGENLVLALSVNPGAAVHSVPVMKAECSWYSVAHANEESLLVSVGKNETGKSRSIYVHIAVSYTRNVGLTIIQEAE
ncbi:MAG: hypothetical protein LBC85_10595, partial [Fibromonadaceae bacterium]|nr:hypothetical protein [Fibromonadaceae bacterium]